MFNIYLSDWQYSFQFPNCLKDLYIQKRHSLSVAADFSWKEKNWENELDLNLKGMIYRKKIL